MVRKFVGNTVAKLEDQYMRGEIEYAEYRKGLTLLYRQRLASSMLNLDAKVTVSKDPWPRASARLVVPERER